MSVIYSFLIGSFLILSVTSAGLKALDRPQVYVSWPDKQFRYLTMPDEHGREVRVDHYKDPRYKKILKEGNYDVVWVR